MTESNCHFIAQCKTNLPIAGASCSDIHAFSTIVRAGYLSLHLPFFPPANRYTGQCHITAVGASDIMSPTLNTSIDVLMQTSGRMLLFKFRTIKL